MSRPAVAALALGALLLSACGSSSPKLQRLPPAEMREILPPPSVATAPGPTPAPAPTPDALPAVAGAGAAAAPQVAPATAPDAPRPIAPATTPSPPAAAEADASQQFTISLSKGDEASAPPSAAPRPVDEAGWPRSFTATGVAFEVHEPQVQSWDGAVLVADAAVVAQPDGQRQPVPGLVRMTARTVVDKAAGTVAVEDLTLTDASFPAARDREPAWLGLLRSFAPRSVKRLSLAHLEESVRQAKALAQGRAAVPDVVPRIIVARNPAVLVAIDGDPRFVPVPETKLQGVRNTRVVLLKDAAGKLYLRVYNGWLSASALRGPWAIAQEPPGADRALKAAIASGRANLLTGKPDAKTGKLPALTKNKVPLIVVSTQPAILVGVSGDPKFVPIPGTSLEYVGNTAAHIFRDANSKRLYVLAGGRWFQGTATRGSFDLTPTSVDKLPADFARVPASSPKAAAAAFAKPGGGPARVPQLALPTVVAAPRSQAHFDVVINGDPKLEPIAGTELNYVANASAPIIQVDINDWYGEQNGVWFKATDAPGPWTVTDKIPPEIYTIPPSVPIYHAIHSRVFASTKDVVYYGYSPDYYGTTGGATGVSVEGEDYQTTPPAGMVWGWFY